MAVALLAGKPKQLGPSVVSVLATTAQTALLTVTNAAGESEQLVVQVGTGFTVNNRTWLLIEVVRVGHADEAALKGKAVARIENTGY